MAAQKAEIFFFKEGVQFLLRNKSEISKWLIAVAKKKKKKILSLNYIFVNDNFLLKMNRKYLNHDTFTDIITFDNSFESNSKNNISGEIYISIDRVKDNAKNLGNSANDELHRVMAHGLLHLCGFGDKTPKEIKRMRAEEENALDLRKF